MGIPRSWRVRGNTLSEWTIVADWQRYSQYFWAGWQTRQRRWWRRYHTLQEQENRRSVPGFLNTLSGLVGYRPLAHDFLKRFFIVSLCTALFLIHLNYPNKPAMAIGNDPCATPGKDGPGTVSAIVNSYFAANSGTLNAGVANTTITLGAQSGATTPVAVGDLLMLIQMQDADIDSSNSDSYGDGSAGGGGTPPYNNLTPGLPATGASGHTAINNAGRYEFVQAIAVSGGGGSGSVITIKGTGANKGLNYEYRQANFIANTSGRRSYQIIRVPQYASMTLAMGAASVVPPWNGTIGGVFAVDVAGEINFANQTLDLRGKGFRGGAGRRLSGNSTVIANSNYDYRTDTSTQPNKNGSKGEGIAGTPRYVLDYFDPSTISATDGNPTGTLTFTDNTDEGYPNGSYSRGAPSNAGGGSTDGNATSQNDFNSGGGGGSNGGDGGNGGRSFSNQIPTGGYGGKAFTTTDIDNGQRLIMGGGGGAGTTNNASRSISRTQTGIPLNYSNTNPTSANQRESDTPAGIFSSGGAGGGVVIIRANSLTGTGTIDVRGVAGLSVGRDGAGGGGAGGTVYITANNDTGASISVQGSGGPGGYATFGLAHGPGGGGGGGVLVRKTTVDPLITYDLSGGAGGQTGTTNNFGPPNHGAVAGAGTALLIDAVDSPGIKSGDQCIPELTVTKTTSTPTINKPATGAMTATYTITVSNAALKAPATNVVISDLLPTGFTLDTTTAPIITLSTGATRTSTVDPGNGATNPSWGNFTIPEAESVTITFNVSIPNTQALGTYQNPATATYDDPRRTIANGTTTAAYNSASSTAEDVTIVAANPPNVLLVKRITSLNGINTGFTTFVNDTNSTDDNDPAWPANFLVGQLVTAASPGDEIEYTIYFINTGNSPAQSVHICDPLSEYLEFVPNTYNPGTPTDGGLPSDRGIQLTLGSTTPTTNYLTGVSDPPDRGQFVNAGVDLTGTCKVRTNDGGTPTDPSDDVYGDLNASLNPSGVVIVDVTRASSPTQLDAVSTPDPADADDQDAYGFIRFRALVK